MRTEVNLDDTTNCPRGDEYCVCDATDDLAVAIFATSLGVFCDTLCGECAHAAKAPHIPSATMAIFLVMTHCEHLGITIDEMATALNAEWEN
jgi:hypothetical protein